MAAPNKAERQKCWQARDEFWKCLDECDDNRTKCKTQRSAFEASCTAQWVNDFWTMLCTRLARRNWKTRLAVWSTVTYAYAKTKCNFNFTLLFKLYCNPTPTPTSTKPSTCWSWLINWKKKNHNHITNPIPAISLCILLYISNTNLFTNLYFTIQCSLKFRLCICSYMYEQIQSRNFKSRNRTLDFRLHTMVIVCCMLKTGIEEICLSLDLSTSYP